jgi:hypothetical protein
VKITKKKRRKSRRWRKTNLYHDKYKNGMLKIDK